MSSYLSFSIFIAYLLSLMYMKTIFTYFFKKASMKSKYSAKSLSF